MEKQIFKKTQEKYIMLRNNILQTKDLPHSSLLVIKTS